MLKKEALLLKFCFLLLVGIQLTSCYAPEEGCLDPESTNYSIDGDNACLDCCVYPVMELSIFHENKDTTFRLEDTIVNDLEQQISLVDFVYLLSNFKFSSEENDYEVQDVISLLINDSEVSVKDDIIRVSRDDFTYDLGTMIYDGQTDRLSFQIGLSEDLNRNRFATEIEDHPLTTDPDSLFQNDSGTYVFQRLKVAQGIDFLDTVIYDISSAFSVSFEIDYVSVKGEDKAVVIEAQYDKWFEGVDFNTMTKSEIEEKIGENSSNVLRNKM